MTSQPRRRGRRVAATMALGGAVLIIAAACAGLAGPNNVAAVDTNHISGFWSGLWQGIVLPISFVVSLFTKSVSIYDVHNNGNWYNFGFVLGTLFIPGAGSRAIRR